MAWFDGFFGNLSQSEKNSEIKPPLRMPRIFQQTLLVNSMWIIVVCSTSLINGFPSSSLKYTMIDARAFRFSFPVSQWIKKILKQHCLKKIWCHLWLVVKNQFPNFFKNWQPTYSKSEQKLPCNNGSLVLEIKSTYDDSKIQFRYALWLNAN